MYELNIKVRNKIAVQIGKAEYICGNSDFIAVFDFDSEWDAYDTKTARFSSNGSYTDIVFNGNQCAVPVITDTHCFHIGVYAGDLHTTTAARVPCKKSILCGDGSPADPAPDVYNQLMERMSELETPDWNQNDSTKKDYIKNRTHWEERTVIDLGEHTFSEGFFIDDFPPDGKNIRHDETTVATIVFDGVSYTCAATSDDEFSFAFGNLHDTGEPFVVGVAIGRDDTYWVCLSETQEEDHTVSVSIEGFVTHPIDPKYISGRIVQVLVDDMESERVHEEEIDMPLKVLNSRNSEYRPNDVRVDYDGTLFVYHPDPRPSIDVTSYAFPLDGVIKGVGSIQVVEFKKSDFSSLSKTDKGHVLCFYHSNASYDKIYYHVTLTMVSAGGSVMSTVHGYTGIFTTIDGYVITVCTNIFKDSDTVMITAKRVI